MTQTTLFKAAAATLALGMLLFGSCKKDDKSTTNPTTTEDYGYTNEHTVAEKSYSDAEDLADRAGNTTGSDIGLKETSSCATVTRSTGRIEIDFGATDCLCSDGRYRRGKIIVTFTGRYADSASTHTITFDNYYQNFNKVSGTKTVTNMGRNSLGQIYFNISLNGSVRFADSTRALTNDSVITNWTRVRTWVAGSSTLGMWSDDAYTITGSGTITRPSGAVVNVNIPAATPLYISAGCRYIMAGNIIYTLPSGLTRTINYGDNSSPTCDNIAIVTIGSRTYTVYMP
jgi:hypothetical protein